MKNASSLSITALAIAAGLACSGDKDDPAPPPAAATKLAYTNPAPGQGEYWLEAAAGSGTNAVTLALRGPSSVTARGANFGLSLDAAKARFVQDGSNFAKPGTVFFLGDDPQIFRAALDAQQKSLRVSMAQKGASVAARPLDGPIATVTLQLQPGTQKGPVALGALAEDGANRVLLANGSVEPIAVKVGTLEAQ
jgi:hypothetical protein